TDGAAVAAHGLGDAARDRSGAASDVEHREARAEQRGEPPVSGRERAGVEDRGGTLGHVRAAARDVTFGYHLFAGGEACPPSRNTRAAPATRGWRAAG